MFFKSRRRPICKKRNKTMKKYSKSKSPHQDFMSAVSSFDYETEWEQVFKTKQERQKKLNKSIKAFKKSVEKYIQSRRKIMYNAIVE